MKSFTCVALFLAQSSAFSPNFSRTFRSSGVRTPTQTMRFMESTATSAEELFVPPPEDATFLEPPQQRQQPLLSVLAATAAVAALAVGTHAVDVHAVVDHAQQLSSSVWLAYSNVLAESPVATKSATSATVYTIGDVIAQRTEGAEQINVARTTRSMLAGAIGHGPMSHVWYGVCDGFFHNVLHCDQWWNFVPKIAVDQMVWGPIWNNSYILLLGLMKLDRPETIVGEMKRTTIPLVLSSLKLWPLAHVITYGLIPVENRLLWVDLVEIVWVTILATAASGHDAKEAAE